MTQHQKRQKVLGIGGIFFRADDLDALRTWYHQHLGINIVPTDYDMPCWQQEAGSTVFAPFAHDTDYFGNQAQQWMINFRVADLSAMVAQLQEAGITVEADVTEHPNGWFARLQDPEGNPIELWQEK